MPYARVVDNDAGPDWVREAVRAVRNESVRFVVTALACTRHPYRFATAWVRGETEALNPIGYLSTALAITAAVKAVTTAILPLGDDNGFWSNVSTATLPYAYYVLLGILCHAALRATGTTRALRASMGIALYVGGGPGLLLHLLSYLDLWLYVGVTGTTHLENNFQGAPWWSLPLLMLPTLVVAGYFWAALAIGLRGVHATSRLRGSIALLVAVVISGMLLSALHSVFEFNLGVPHFLVQFGGGIPFSIALL
jgi:hypothetical protein